MPLPHYTSAATAAALLRVTPGAISHDIERGRFKDVRRWGGNFTDISTVEVIQRLGRPLTDVEQQLLEKPRYERKPRPLSDEAWNALVDPGVQRRFAEIRDASWHRHLSASGVKIGAPPIDDLAKIELDNQNFFTREQVETLLANTLDQRDRAWRNWVASDLTEQAQRPNGPAPMYLRNITSIEEE